MEQRYGNPGKVIMSIDMLLWAMKEADPGDAGQKQQWADHRYVAPAFPCTHHQPSGAQK